MILCEKEPVQKYAEERAKKYAEAEAKRLEQDNKVSDSGQWKELKAMFEKLSPEERAKVLAQMNGK